MIGGNSVVINTKQARPLWARQDALGGHRTRRTRRTRRTLAAHAAHAAHAESEEREEREGEAARTGEEDGHAERHDNRQPASRAGRLQGALGRAGQAYRSGLPLV